MRPTPHSANPDLPDDLLRELTDAELDALALGVKLAEECRTLAPGEIRDPMRHFAENASLLTDAQLDDTISIRYAQEHVRPQFEDLFRRLDRLLNREGTR